MRRSVLALALVACAAFPGITACADILGVREYTYVGADGALLTDGSIADGSVPDSDSDSDTDGTVPGDAMMTDGGMMEAAPDAGCTLCVGNQSTPCALSCNETTPRYLAVDSTRLYFANGTTLRALVRPSGAPSTFASSGTNPNASSASGAQFYFTDGNAVKVAALDGGVRTLQAIAGARAVAGAPPQASTLLFYATATGLYKCTLPDCTSPLLQIDMRLDPQGLAAIWDPNPGVPYGYWVEMGTAQHLLNGGQLVGGFSVTSYASNAQTTNVLAAEDKQHVWYTTFSGATTNLYLVGDNNPKLQTQGVVRGLAAGGGMVWLAIDDMQNGRVVKFDGNNGNVVAQGQDRPSSIVLDATFVYWTTLGGTVMRAGR